MTMSVSYHFLPYVFSCIKDAEVAPGRIRLLVRNLCFFKCREKKRHSRLVLSGGSKLSSGYSSSNTLGLIKQHAASLGVHHRYLPKNTYLRALMITKCGVSTAGCTLKIIVLCCVEIFISVPLLTLIGKFDVRKYE